MGLGYTWFYYATHVYIGGTVRPRATQFFIQGYHLYMCYPGYTWAIHGYQGYPVHIGYTFGLSFGEVVGILLKNWTFLLKKWTFYHKWVFFKFQNLKNPP